MRAEHAGIVAALLRGQGSRAGYALLLRNLWPVYRVMESETQRHRALAAFAQPALLRADALAADLVTLCGEGWAERLPLLPAGARYAHRIARAGEGGGARLLAHAYVRTLGDLSGGQILARRLADTLRLPPAALQFHAFPGVPDLAAAKAGYRAALDAAGAALADPEAVLREAQIAFRLNISLSEAVLAAAVVGRSGGPGAIC